MKGVPFEVENAAEVRKDVDWLADKKVDMVKIWVDDHFGKERKIPMDLSKAIIEEAHKHGSESRRAYLLSGRREEAWWNAGLDVLAAQRSRQSRG